MRRLEPLAVLINFITDQFTGTSVVRNHYRCLAGARRSHDTVCGQHRVC